MIVLPCNRMWVSVAILVGFWLFGDATARAQQFSADLVMVGHDGEAPMPAGSTRADFEARHAHFPFNALPEPRQVDADGFVEVLDAPTGFMLIERSVFTRLAAAMPGLRYTPDASLDTRAADWAHYRFFDVLAEPGNGRYLTEDYAFCRRWQSIGGSVFADTHSRLEHQGLRTYTGDLQRALIARQG